MPLDVVELPGFDEFVIDDGADTLLIDNYIYNLPADGMMDFNSSLARLVEEEYVHQQVALEATPKPEELKMILKGFS